MEYNKIVAITGMNGLYELISSKTDGAIVRSLSNNSTKFVTSRVHNFSHLETIEVYTVNENVNLVTIFNIMENSEEAIPDVKNAGAVKAYFQSVYPDIDFNRVYMSDMKKMIKWFEILRNTVEFKLPAKDTSDTATDKQQDQAADDQPDNIPDSEQSIS